ncbi:MAG: hypothetical protein ACYDCH_10535 [Gaiellaceae bacterium]
MLVAVLILLGLGVSATGMAQLTEIRLTQAVNYNWRGAYDILVTPRSARATSGAATTSGLIEPDFLAYGGHGGISFSQLDAIRRIAGVAVAAPVTTIGYVRADAAAPIVSISKSLLPKAPTLYRLSLRVTTSDGVHRFTVSRQTVDVLLGPVKANGPALPFLDSAGVMSGTQDSVDVGLNSLEPPVTPVVAVDPTAEQRLLGPSFSFLKALLIKAPELRLANFPHSLIPPQFPVAAGQLGSLQDAARRGGNAAYSEGGAYPEEPVVPILVSDHLAYPLRLTLAIDRIGHPLRSYPRADQPVLQQLATVEHEAGPGARRIGVVSLNLSSLRAFEPPSLTLLWPGSSSENGQTFLTHRESSLDAQLARRATYTRKPGPRRSVPAYRIKPLGLVGWNGEPPQRAESPTSSYRSFTSESFAVKPTLRRRKGFGAAPAQNFFLAPVGTFDFGKLQLPTNPLNHIPIGAYEPATALLLPRQPDQRAEKLTPTENPLGFLTSPPEVIAPISEAALLRGSAPIDAVRVRVAELSGFDTPARRKVERIASRIAELGLDARIVAGSSPRSVNIYVPRYLPARRNLGWVQEDWTSLGAAQAASTALSGAERALLVLSVVLAFLLAVTVSSVGVEGGARDVRIWKSLGWDRRRMLWWLVSDAAIGSLLIAVASVAASLLGHGPGGLVYLGLGLSASLFGTQVAFALLMLRRELQNTAAEPSRRRRPRRSGRATSPHSGIAIARHAVLRQGRISILIAAGIALSAIVVAVGVGALRSGARSAGPSLLGAYLNGDLLAFHVISLVLLVAGGAASAVIATRAWQRRRGSEILALAAAGWERSRVVAELRLERALLAAFSLIPALAVAAALSSSGVTVGGALAVPIVIVLCGSYVAAAEPPTRRFVERRWPM